MFTFCSVNGEGNSVKERGEIGLDKRGGGVGVAREGERQQRNMKTASQSVAHTGRQ